MPLILAPYTLGTQLPAAPVAAGGGGFYVRRRRFLAYTLTSFLLLVLA